MARPRSAEQIHMLPEDQVGSEDATPTPVVRSAFEKLYAEKGYVEVDGNGERVEEQQEAPKPQAKPKDTSSKE